MRWYEDSILCLEEAKELIEQIKWLEEASIQSEELLSKCKPKIKNCLENLRSPLDYVAGEIFDKFCKENYTQKELNRLKIYYPVSDTKQNFDKILENKFRGLSKNHKNIIDILVQTQVFSNSDPWIKELSSLVNENKHNRLTINNSIRHLKIHEMTSGSIRFKDVTIIGDVIPIRIADTDYDLINKFPEGTTEANVDAKNEIYFADFYSPAVELLENILKNVTTTIDKLRYIL